MRVGVTVGVDVAMVGGVAVGVDVAVGVGVVIGAPQYPEFSR